MKKTLQLGLILALALIAAYSTYIFAEDNYSPEKDKAGLVTYEGTAQLSRENFTIFKRFIGQPEVTLKKLAVNNNQTEPITVEFIYEMPEDMSSPFGSPARGGFKGATAMAAGIGAFVIVALLGFVFTNLKGMGGRRWAGRH